jgi:hypothetical protein
MKLVLLALALIAVVRPEHFVPVALLAAVVLGLLFLIDRGYDGFRALVEAAVKALLVAMTLIAVVRPEYFVPVVAGGAVAASMLALAVLSLRLWRADARGARSSAPAEGSPPSMHDRPTV